MRPTRRLAIVGASTALLLSGTGLANADQISNNLDSTVDATAEIMALSAGGATGATSLAVNPTNGDGKSGCNLTGSTTLKLSVVNDHPEVATVSPSTITFTSCGDTPTLTVTPLTSGSADISLSLVSNSTGASFDLAPAAFTVNVTAPPPANTPPKVSVQGVTNGATYDVGSVPKATCAITDTEDGDSTKDATLGDITGPDAVDGIGSQTATCDYTDAGGLEAESTATYTIVDPTPPSISYTLDPASPSGLNGWYTGDVTLKWTVSEPDSPHSLTTTGCADQAITADQQATTYSCSASSAGGAAAQQSVTIARDATAPEVRFDSIVGGTPGNNGWYTSNVTAKFTATDATSGLLTDSDTTTSQGEGSAVVIDSPRFTDLAGNTALAGTATTTVKVDKSAPYDLAFVGGPADTGQYYYGQVPAQPTCTATDDVSGLASCDVTGDGANMNAVGTHTWTATATDNAGNTATKQVTYQVLAWTDNGFYAPVNMGITNTVKAGSTVPLKFNVYAGSTELTDTSVVKSFTTKQVSCTDLSSVTDPVEVTSTGATSLRYDTIGHQFIQNWQTPAKSGLCYAVSMTTQDGTHIDADFKLK